MRREERMYEVTKSGIVYLGGSGDPMWLKSTQW